MLKHVLLAIMAAISLSGCASNQPVQQAPALQTKSGKPEIEINAPIDKVKSAIIDSMLSNNYTIEQETDHMIAASHQIDRAAKMKAILNGVHASTKVEQYVTMTMLNENGKTRLIGMLQMRLSNGIQSDLVDNTTGNAEAINSLQDWLNKLKQKAES